jgi:hypothetical protein
VQQLRLPFGRYENRSKFILSPGKEPTMRYSDDRTALNLEIEAKGFILPEDEKERVQGRLDEIGEAIGEYPVADLRIDLVFHEQSQVYHAKLALRVPGRTLLASAKHIYLDSAIQDGMRNLLAELETNRRRPEREVVDELRERQALDEAILPPGDPRSRVVADAARHGDYHTFRTALAGYEEWLRRRVGRWVQRYPTVDARIGGDILIGDLIEQVYLLAFERFAHRPTVVPLHEWLDALIDTAVKAVMRKTDEEHEVASMARTVRAGPLV